MDRIVVKSRVGSDGILQLSVPVGPAVPSADDWRRCILETAGKWEGEFERPAQGEYEEREPLS